MVCVVRGKFPAKVMVAPNSRSAGAQASTARGATRGAAVGRVAQRKVCHWSAPQVAAASSSCGSAERSADSTDTTRYGSATKDSARTTPGVVNGSVTPNHRSRNPPRIPCRPKTSSSAIPATTGGSTRGTVTSERTSRRAGSRARASSQASGTPSSSETPIASVAHSSDSRSAVHEPSAASSAGSCRHGVLASSPTTGSTRKPSPTSAGTYSATGGRSAARLIRAPSSSWLDEARLQQEALAVGGEHVRLEGLRGRRVRPALEHRDRVGFDGRGRRGEVHALDLAAGPGHVRVVDERRVDRAELDLRQGAGDVLLLGDRRQAHFGGLERLLRGGPAGHGRRAQGHLDPA